MPSYATNILPTNTGLNLGASNQEWNAWLNLLNGATPVNQQIMPTPFSATPAFITTTPIAVFTMTLIGNVSASTYSGVPGIVIFQIVQDAIGTRTFAWPTNFNGPITVNPNPSTPIPNVVTTQVFFYDGANGWPLGPGVQYP